MSSRLAPRIDRRLVLLLAVTCGTAVANLYYAQPLLNTIASALGVSEGTAGLLVTASQVGYVAGLALLVPLGDLLERRRLIAGLLVLAAIGQLASAIAPSFAVLAAALLVVGVASAVAQIVVPLASALAADDERGAVVGTVMSGLLIGILLARTLSGLLAEIGGWRFVFAVAAGAMLILAAVLMRSLPVVAPTTTVRYPTLLRSVLRLIGEERVLRERMLLGATGMAGFSVLWTSIAFLLGGAPYHYGDGVIGLFGLAGLAGALMAPIAGRLADRGHGRLASTIGLVALPISWVLLDFGSSSLIALVVGIVVLDFAVQAVQISNQSTIYALRPDARSRITTAYMVAYFVGGVSGSIGSSLAYGAGGWNAVCGLGFVVAMVGLVGWIVFARRAAADAGSDAVSPKAAARV